MADVLPGVLSDIAEFLDLQFHYSTLTRGIISLESILFMGFLIVLGFVLATASLRRRLWV